VATRKELKQPDAFQKVGAEAMPWLVERRKTLLIGVVIALLGFGGVAFANFLSDRGEASAARNLGAAMEVLTRPVDEKGLSKPEPGSTEEPPFKSQTEKDDAVLKALVEFRDAHKGTRAAGSAALPLAQVYARKGQPDEALKLYDEYLKTAVHEEPLRAEALEGKGYALEAKGELDQALAAFDQLDKENKSEFLAGMGQYHRARILIAQGKKDEAIKLLSEIPVSAPNSSAARLANERTAVLIAEGVKPPPPPAPPPAATGKDAG
jgi:tetratricopeptide (TPR) repeat protein